MVSMVAGWRSSGGLVVVGLSLLWARFFSAVGLLLSTKCMVEGWMWISAGGHVVFRDLD